MLPLVLKKSGEPHYGFQAKEFEPRMLSALAPPSQSECSPDAQGSQRGISAGSQPLSEFGVQKSSCLLNLPICVPPLMGQKGNQVPDFPRPASHRHPPCLSPPNLSDWHYLLASYQNHTCHSTHQISHKVLLILPLL